MYYQQENSPTIKIWEEKGIAWAIMSVRKRLMSESRNKNSYVKAVTEAFT